MGYYTDYELEIKSKDQSTTIGTIVSFMKSECDELRKFYPFEYCMDDYIDNDSDYADICSCDETKWYDYHEEMLDLSSTFPNVLFRLHGEGEEQEDIWDCYYQNGKSARYEARIIIDPFDPNDLK